MDTSSLKHAIVVKNLNKHYNGVRAVNNVSFTVSWGTIHGLLGLNGAGKTTTLKCLVGLLKPDHVDELTVNGVNALSDYSYKQFIGYLPENPPLPEYLTPFEFLTYLGKIRGITTDLRERVDEMLEIFKLNEVNNRMIVELSKGLRQRLALATVFLHRPRIIILDEPFLGLDLEGQMLVKKLIKETVMNGGAVLVSTHILEIVEKLCSHITIIHRGRILASGKADEITGNLTLEETFFNLINRA